MKILICGASRGVGRCAVQQALEGGHEVTAFARNPSSLPRDQPRLTIVAGDATNPADVARAVVGHDAVLSTLGPDSRKGSTTLHSTAASAIVHAMTRSGVRRLIALSNFGVLSEGSAHPVTGLLAWMVRHSIRDALADHRLALQQMQDSSLDWIAVRPMALTNGAHTGKYRVVADGLPRGGTHISRADVADFMLKQVAAPQFNGKVPALAY